MTNVPTPMANVEGKVALVTGGSSGIGLGIARAFAEAGMRIAITYRTKRHLDEAMGQLEGVTSRVCAIDVDVTDRNGMAGAAETIARTFGKLHVLVNNAGVVHPAPISETTYADWDWVMNVNLTGVFNGIHTFLPYIRSHGEGGHVIATSSIMGLCAFGAAAAAYSVSKFAVVGLMEVLRAELAGANIGVSVFCPGVVTSNVGDSRRNRPRDADDPVGRAPQQARKQDNGVAMDPFDVGRLVLKGMRDNDLYILTHAEYGQIVRQRGDVLNASSPSDVPATKARRAMARTWLRDSIYVAERHRQRAALPESQEKNA